MQVLTSSNGESDSGSDVGFTMSMAKSLCHINLIYYVTYLCNIIYVGYFFNL